MKLSKTHQKIIDAVIQKSRMVCPDVLDLIAVYGSAATGDIHEKSDLDLMILISDDSGWTLSKGFILDDIDVGYDLYCTTWEMLEGDAACEHAQLSKLMDSEIVYVGKEEAVSRLKRLREQASRILASSERFEKAAVAFSHAKTAFCDCILSDTRAEVLEQVGETVYYLLGAVMLYHGQYFKRGTKRNFDELRSLPLDVDLEAYVLRVLKAESLEEMKQRLAELMKTAGGLMKAPSEPRETPSAANLSGTYEEMYSNWHGKMKEATVNHDVYSSFMNLSSLQYMIHDIASGVEIPDLSFVDQFDPLDLQKNEVTYDQALDAYLNEYKAIGLLPKRFPNVEAFLADYLS